MYADSMGEFRRQTSEKIGGMQVVNIRVGFMQGTCVSSKLSWLIPRHKNYDYKGEKSRDPSLPPQYAMFGETTFKKLSVLWDGGAFQSHFIRARQNSDMLVQVISAWKYSDLMFADGLLCTEDASSACRADILLSSGAEVTTIGHIGRGK